MLVLNFAWKNLWRNRGRTAITISAIFFAVALSVTTSSLQDGVFDHTIRNIVSFYNGYIQIHKQGYWNQQILDNAFKHSDTLEQSVSLEKNVTATAPRIESFALASVGENTRGCMVVGIAPQKEAAITFLNDKVIEGEYFNDTESRNIALLTEGLARKLELQLHDTVYLISQGYHGAMAAGKYSITGILKFGSPQLNEQLLYLPLHVAQEFYNAEGMVTSYVLSLKSDRNIQKTAASLKATIGNEYEVITWQEMLPDLDQHMKTDKGSMYIISGILYMLIGFGIFGTLLIMMTERKYEMGMLIAVGMKKSKLIVILMIESILSVLLGCITGILLSIPIVYYLKIHPIRFGGELAEMFARYGFEPIFPASTDIRVFAIQGLVVLVLGLVLSVYPIIKVLKLVPVTAMKR